MDSPSHSARERDEGRNLALKSPWTCPDGAFQAGNLATEFSNLSGPESDKDPHYFFPRTMLPNQRTFDQRVPGTSDPLDPENSLG